MSAMPTEALRVESLYEAVQESGTGHEENQVIMAGLAGYFDGQGRVLNYEALVREDYTGTASDKVRVGGALVVECSILAGDAFQRRAIEIDDAHRGLSEDVISLLGARAEDNRKHGRKLIRDVFTFED